MKKFYAVYIKPYIHFMVAFVLSVGLVFAIAVLLFTTLPKSSWVAIDTVPHEFELKQFSGRINTIAHHVIFANNIHNTASFKNLNSVTVRLLSGEEYEVSPLGLKLEFEKPESETQAASNILLFTPYAHINTFPTDIRATVATSSELEPSFARTYHIRLSSNWRSQPQMELKISASDYLEIFGFSEIYIKGEKIDTQGSITILPWIREDEANYDNFEFSLCSDNASIFINKEENQVFEGLYEEQPTIMLPNYQNDYLYLAGRFYSFEGLSGSGYYALNHTYLNNQKSYDIGNLNILGESSQPTLNCEFGVGNYNNFVPKFNISGAVDRIEIAGSSLYYTLPQFILNNIGALCIAAFTTIIAMLTRRNNDNKPSPAPNREGRRTPHYLNRRRFNRKKRWRR